MADRGRLLVVLSVLTLAASSVQQQHRLVVRLEPGSSATHCATLENVLTETSEQLYNVTRGRVQWDRIVLLLPRNYTADCALSHQPRRVIKGRRADRRIADLIVGDRHPLLGDLPWSQQYYGGCGQSGRGVHLSRSFISDGLHNNSFYLQGRKVLREWVKNRYGVFDERGFEGDVQYPVMTSPFGSHPPHQDAPIEPNTCTTLRNRTDMVPISWMPEGEEDEENATMLLRLQQDEQLAVKVTPAITTSIMAALDAEDFCSEENHIRWMPSKQNLLCDEKSVWQVLNGHPDFQSPSSLSGPSAMLMSESWPNDITTDIPEADDSSSADIISPFFPPEFEYILPTNDRYVLVVDRSEYSSQSKWSLVRRSLYRWVHALPNETYLSVIVSGHQESGSPVLPWTKVTTENRDGLLGRIPRRPASSVSPAQLSSAVQLAYQLLNDEEESSCCGGQLVLLSGSEESVNSLNLVIPSSMDSSGIASITVHTIVFPSQSAHPDLSSVTLPAVHSGLQLAVPDEDDPSGSIQSKLSSALLEVLRYSSASAPIQVYEETLTAGQTATATTAGGTFTLDSPLGENVWIVAHCADEADLDTIEVLSPTGRIYDLPLVSDGMLHIRIPRTDEFGQWTYRLRFSPPVSAGRTARATVEVTAQPVDDSLVSVTAWTNVGRRSVNASSEAILIYAQVTLGLLTPVLNAKVTAFIRPPGNESRSVYVVQLYDRGTGDPDVTRADGIYSAYFTHAVAEPGHYSVTIQVTDDSRRASIPIRSHRTPTPEACCGSSMPFSETRSIQSFRRIVSGPSFSTFAGPEEDEDVYPPGRITDLRVERINNSTNEAEFAWTAPGSDYDSGTASLYQIRCYTDRSALNDSLAILVHASLTPMPLPAGSVQRTSVAVPWPNQLFYYAVVAVDPSGLTGQISNIVPVYIHEPPPPPTSAAPGPAPGQTEADWLSSGGGINVTLPIHHEGGLTEHQLYAVAGGVAGFIVLLILLSVAACISRKRRAGKPDNSAMHGVQVEPMKSALPDVSLVSSTKKPVENGSMAGGMGDGSTGTSDRPVYKIYVNNAYIQEEDGELKIVTPDGRIIQRGSPWFPATGQHHTLPRGRSLTQLEADGIASGGAAGGNGTTAADLALLQHHWSLPRTSKSSPHRAGKVLTNGSIMQHSGSQGLLAASAANTSAVGSGNDVHLNSGGHQTGHQHQVGGAGGDGTSISSKPSVSSEDTGIELMGSDHLPGQAGSSDSRDSSGDGITMGGLSLMDPLLAHLHLPILPPPGFGPASATSTLTSNGQQQHILGGNGYLPMYSGSTGSSGSNLLPPVPPSPGSRDARVVRLPSYNQADWMATSSRKPLMMLSSDGLGRYDQDLMLPGNGNVATSTPQISPPPPSTVSSATSTTAFERPPPVRRKKRHISFV